MEENKFKVILVGIIFKPETRKILIGKNKGDTKYSFLEGELNYEEELGAKLKRITSEKTGYKVHNLGAIYAENMLEEKNKLKLYFLCEATEGDETPGEKVEELKWIKPSQAEEYLQTNLPNHLKEYINNLE